MPVPRPITPHSGARLASPPSYTLLAFPGLLFAYFLGPEVGITHTVGVPGLGLIRGLLGLIRGSQAPWRRPVWEDWNRGRLAAKCRGASWALEAAAGFPP